MQSGDADCNHEFGRSYLTRHVDIMHKTVEWGVELIAGPLDRCNVTKTTRLWCVFEWDPDQDEDASFLQKWDVYDPEDVAAGDAPSSFSSVSTPSATSSPVLLFSPLRSTSGVISLCPLPPQLARGLERRYGAEVLSASGRDPASVLEWSSALPRGPSYRIVSDTGAWLRPHVTTYLPRVLPPSWQPFCLVGATLVLNEARALPAWLLYHYQIGFEHFFVYDDGSTDDTFDVLRPFVEARLVTIVRWQRTGASASRQVAAMEDFRLRFSSLSRLVSFFDVDEYFVPRDATAEAAHEAYRAKHPDAALVTERAPPPEESPDDCQVHCESCKTRCDKAGDCTTSCSPQVCSNDMSNYVVSDLIASRNCSAPTVSEGVSERECNATRTHCSSILTAGVRTCVIATATCMLRSAASQVPPGAAAPEPGSLLPLLHKMINPAFSRGQAVVAWSLFGSSGHDTLNGTGLLSIEAYTQRHPDQTRESLRRPLDARLVHSYKSIALTRCIVSARGMVHKWLLAPSCGDARLPPAELTLNHYYTKSREEWGKRVREGWTGSWKDSNWQAADAGLNEERDTAILRFAGEVRRLLALSPSMVVRELAHLKGRALRSDDAESCPMAGIPKWKREAVKGEREKLYKLIESDRKSSKLRKLDIDEDEEEAPVIDDV